MDENYDIRIWQDNIFAIYLKEADLDYVYKGTIEECNAWMSLKAKGFTT